jgi:hypothetical protein
MSKNRYVNTKFWDDSFIIECDPIEKLLFIYFLTNPLTTICGIYEITIRRIAFDTGIDKDMVLKILDRFEKCKRIKFENGWVGIKNFIKHQSMSDNVKDKVRTGIELSLDNAPKNLKNWVLLDNPLKGYPHPSNYPNPNSNSNPKGNSNTPTPSDKNWPEDDEA